jgi:hypothetical protein
MDLWGGIGRGIGDPPGDLLRSVSRPHCAPEILTFPYQTLKSFASVRA